MNGVCLHIGPRNDIVATTFVLIETSLKKITTHLQYSTCHEELTYRAF